MSNKTKVIWWLIGVVGVIIASYFNFVMASQRSTDQRQDQNLISLTESVILLTANVEKMLEVYNKVNLIELNANVKSIDGRTMRIERKLDL